MAKFLKGTGLFLICLLALFPSVLSAHSCAKLSGLPDKDFRRLIENATIFRGEVVSFDRPENSAQVIHVAVSHRWQGNAEGTVSVLYQGAYSSFEVEIGGIGTEKVFFADWDANRQMLRVYFCGLESQPTEDIQRMEGVLGKGIPVETPTKETVPPITDRSSDSHLVLIAGGAVLFFVPIAVFILTLRR